MNTVTVLFTTRRFNPISWLVRWAVPRSRFALSLSSHCIVVRGLVAYEASMLHGVRKISLEDALEHSIIIDKRQYSVPDADAGFAWAEAQIGKSYDWAGALGLGLTPGRDWKQDDKWFCYEFAAAVIHASGRQVFASLSNVGETALMAINP